MRLLAMLAILVTTAVLLPGVSADKWRGGAGQACMPGMKCNAGLTCDAASNKCIAPAPVGGTTAVQSKLGQACTTNTCASGLSCNGGVCVATPVAVTSVPATGVNACDAVFVRLRAARSVGVLWTTNYHANGVYFGGVTGLSIVRNSAGDLFGRGLRFRYSNLGDVTEWVALRIRADGQIMLNDMYGPYTPVCWSERFVGFHSGDSVEVFNFQPL